MSDEELCKALKLLAFLHNDGAMTQAADRIEALLNLNEALVELMDDRDAELAKAVEALRKLHHAVCGETGFAACVRLDSGLAYPWPALDEADEMTRATLAEIEGEKT
jgi:hypothetical protein